MTVLAVEVAGIGLIAGCLIGAIGVGGVIIVPALVYWLGVPIQDAIAGAMSGYILTGMIGTFIYARHGSIHWRPAGWIWLGAIPGVVLGSWASNMVDPLILKIGIGLLLLSSASSSLFGDSRMKAKRESLPQYGLIGLGAGTSVISALTGTGGPLVLVPTLTWLSLPVRIAVGLSQTVQIPIAVLGTVGNFAFGTPDLSVSATLFITLALGTWIGAKLAHVVPRDRLSRLTAFILLIVGIIILLEIAYPFV